MWPSPAPLQRAPRPARPGGSRPSPAASQGTAPSLGFGAGSCCQRSAPAGSQPHPLPCSFLHLIRAAAPCAPLRQLVPRRRLCPQGRSRPLAPPLSRERVRAGCSASGPVQFYCTGANRTEVGTIGGFLSLPAPQREPWVSFFVDSFFLCVVFLPSQGRRFPPLEPRCQPLPGGSAAPSLSQGFFAFGCVFWLLFLISVLLYAATGCGVKNTDVQKKPASGSLAPASFFFVSRQISVLVSLSLWLREGRGEVACGTCRAHVSAQLGKQGDSTAPPSFLPDPGAGTSAAKPSHPQTQMAG